MIPKIPQALVAEHQELHAELAKLTLRRGKVGEAALAAVAKQERKPEAARFAEALELHAPSDLYPAAPLVGEYVRAPMDK